MRPLAFLQGSGMVAFVLFRLYGSVIANPVDLRMHTPLALTNFALSILLNLVLTGAVFAFLGRWIEASPRLRWLRFALAGVLLALLIKVLGINLGVRNHPLMLIAILVGTTLFDELYLSIRGSANRLLCNSGLP
jgi:hypothetical protein